MSWSDRFAVIDHFKPTDDQITTTFGLTQDELDTARQMRSAGTFMANPNLDVMKYQHVFTATAAPKVAPTAVVSGSVSSASVSAPTQHTTMTMTAPKQPTKQGNATSYSKPESATKKAKVPQKRGRKGDKIANALSAVPTTQVPAEEFSKQHNVSLAVLRQSKRFLDQMSPEQRAAIGKINVRQDKATHTLMIWREPTPS